jgi:hypothetical protein
MKLLRQPRIELLLSGPLVSCRSSTLDQFWVHVYPTDSQLQFHQGGNAEVLELLHAINNAVNGLDRRLSRIEVVMENARIVKRNQKLRSLAPGQVYSARQKEASMFPVL